MNYECAKWSVQVVLAFSAEYNSLLGLRDRFSEPFLDFKLP